MIEYIVIALLLLAAELVYFRIADKCNIIDKPNERSSHKTIVLRGGGIIFTIGLWIWYLWFMVKGEWFMVNEYWPLLAGVTLAAGVSFIDDIHSLPDSLRLIVQFASMFLVFQEVGLLTVEDGGSWLVQGLIVLAALIVCVGGTNIYNFMDGINGITGGYSLAILIPLIIKNEELRMKNGEGFVEPSFLIVIGLSLLVFCLFNFRKKAKCFAGDVGSIGIALILTFCLARLMMVTGDVAWIVLFLIYGVDGVLTICHRIMLHENLGQAHRKHAYQLMANELKIPHVVVSTIYMVLQLVVSLIAIYVIPDTVAAHWIYLVCSGVVMAVAYVLFKMKYYHLHEEYLRSIKKQ
jgi:UDP-N-acetylmuramyl pentapeptide phosphotransferase/UDP-N-acetylglucosamine-1-phosphate transferase